MFFFLFFSKVDQELMYHVTHQRVSKKVLYTLYGAVTCRKFHRRHVTGHEFLPSIAPNDTSFDAMLTSSLHVIEGCCRNVKIAPRIMDPYDYFYEVFK